MLRTCFPDLVLLLALAAILADFGPDMPCARLKNIQNLYAKGINEQKRLKNNAAYFYDCLIIIMEYLFVQNT